MKKLSRIGMGIGIGLLALVLLYTASADTGRFEYGGMMGYGFSGFGGMGYYGLGFLWQILWIVIIIAVIYFSLEQEWSVK